MSTEYIVTTEQMLREILALTEDEIEEIMKVLFE